MPRMFYEEFSSSPDLATHVAKYWTMTVAPEIAPGFPHVIYPNGCISLVCAVKPAGEVRVALVGPRTDEFSVPVAPGDRYWGVTFWPDAGGSVMGVPARRLGGVVGLLGGFVGDGLAAALGDAAARCRTQDEAAGAFDRLLAPRISAAPPLDLEVRASVVGLIASRGEVPVLDLAREVGVSPRQLQRRFGDLVGLTPKQFARIRRFRSAMGELLQPNPRTWSAVAAELGYADQSHLVREFVQLAGRPPAAVARGIRAITHGRVTP